MEHLSTFSLSWKNQAKVVFPAFASKNYKYYFLGQSISLIGTWLQMVSQGWLVFSLTHSAFWVGVVTAAGNLPVLILGLFSGVLTDMVERKKILLLCQYSAMVLALVLGGLTLSGHINIINLTLLSFLLGIVSAIDMPARQAFLSEMVNKSQIASATALNSGMFNGARVIGPGVAGMLIYFFGVGGAFILNGLSYIAAIIALYMINPYERTIHPVSHPLTAIKEGVTYVKDHPIIRNLLTYTAIVTIFGFSYMTILPVMVNNIYHQNAAFLGYLYAASGLGAVCSSITLSFWGNRVSNTALIGWGTVLSAAALFLFASTTSPKAAYLTMFVCGFGLVMLFSIITTTLHHMTDDKYRGRVMSIYTIAFLGIAPLGSFLIGLISEKISTPFAIQYGCIVYLSYGFFIFLRRNTIRRFYKNYQEQQIKL